MPTYYFLMIPQKNDSAYNRSHIILSNENYNNGAEYINLTDTELGSLAYGINSRSNKSDLFDQ